MRFLDCSSVNALTSWAPIWAHSVRHTKTSSTTSVDYIILFRYACLLYSIAGQWVGQMKLKHRCRDTSVESVWSRPEHFVHSTVELQSWQDAQVMIVPSATRSSCPPFTSMYSRIVKKNKKWVLHSSRLPNLESSLLAPGCISFSAGAFESEPSDVQYELQERRCARDWKRREGRVGRS